jgi:hypothetical protein
LIVAARLPQRLSPAAALTAYAFGVSFVEDCVGWWLSRHGAPNLWFLHLAMPVFPSLLIWALSLWQRSDVSRLAFRLTIPLFVVTWAILLLHVERLPDYSFVGGPIRSVLLVTLACYTLVTNARQSLNPVWRADWFWISSGLLLSFSARVVLTPISASLVNSAPAELIRMDVIFNAIDVIATLLVSWGVFCAKRESASGGFSSPHSRSRVFSRPRS